MGRVLVITAEVSVPSTFDMLERYALSHVSFSCVTSDLSPSMG